MQPTVNKKRKIHEFYNRVVSTSTGAVLDGLIGAAIEEGISSKKNSGKKRILTALIDDTTSRRLSDRRIGQSRYYCTVISTFSDVVRRSY